MFHVELRQFPHNACTFNLTEAELSQIVEPWSRDQWIELGERKWSPHQARLTILEGPHLPVQELAMGRGWRNAQHQSADVTERVIARALASPSAAPTTVETVAEPSAASSAPPAPAENGAPSGDRASAMLDIELHSLLGPDPAALLQAWRLAAQRRPELSPSESLALAESTLRSLDAPRS